MLVYSVLSFFSSKLCVPVYFFVIDGKCRVLFIRSNLFFFFSKHDFWKWPTCYACSREANFWKPLHAAAAVALHLFRERATKPKGKFLSCWRKKNKTVTSVASDIHWKGRPSPEPINSKASLRWSRMAQFGIVLSLLHKWPLRNRFREAKTTLKIILCLITLLQQEPLPRGAPVK